MTTKTETPKADDKMGVPLGKQGLVVSKIGFGAMGITAFYGAPMKDEDALKLLKHVHSLGCTHFDTAEVYRSGNPYEPPNEATKFNETIVGQYVQSVSRDSVTVATKFNPGLYKGVCDLATVEASLDASLKRLGLEYVDLYYLHRMPATLEILKEWMAAAAAMVKKGKIKYVGLSEVSPAWLKEAHAVHPVAAIQQEWSLLTREPIESLLVPVCKELGIAIVAYSPLARNLLTEQKEPPKDWRATNPRYSEENFAKNQLLTKKISEMAEAKKASAAQLSLAWLYYQAEQMGVTVVPIPGTTKEANASSNIASADLQLSKEEATALADLSKLVAGPRGNEAYVASCVEGVMTRPAL